MTADERAHSLRFLGLTERQTRFVATVALHSGYCLRGQYLQFASVKYGRNVRDFLDGLVVKRWATRAMCRSDRGYVYHLHAKAIYRALGQEDNRNRRKVAPAVIPLRLMLLDVVLLDPTTEWYATEQGKVALFTSRFGVSPAELPQRRYSSAAPAGGVTTRYFVNKLPIGTRAETVTFVYLAIDTGVDGFEVFLEDHAALLRRLPSWRIAVFFSSQAVGREQYGSVFDGFLSGRRSPTPVTASDLRWFFEMRQLVEHNRWETFSVNEDAPRFRALRKVLTTPRYEQLYAEWLRVGPAALAGHTAEATPRAPGLESDRGRLILRRLEHDYGHFATLGAAADEPARQQRAGPRGGADVGPGDVIASRGDMPRRS